MNIAAFVEALQQDLAAVAAMGDESTAEAARRISAALEPSLRLRLMDVLGEAAVELTSQLPDGHVEVRLAGGDPELVFVEDRPTGPAPTAGDDSLSARVTLRLPEALKAVIDAAAQEAGVSANTWLLQQISRSTGSKRRGPGRRMTGFGQS